MSSLGLTLGPLLFHWPADRWSDFYARVADEAPVDRVCIGEVVCSKRLPFYADRIADTVERLRRGGKRVLLSSLALVTQPRERRLSCDLAESADLEVEINDLGLLARLEPGKPFAVGPLINVYGEDTLGFLCRRGASLICLPPELPLTSVAELASTAGRAGALLEVWGFGRLPLAISARCYHARVHGLAKDACQFVCGEDADGLAVDTVDGGRFLAVNGVQTLSYAFANAIGDLADLRAAGVASLRLSPHDADMVAVARTFRAAADGAIDAEEADESLHALLPGARFANGFLRGEPGAAWRPPRSGPVAQKGII